MATTVAHSLTPDTVPTTVATVTDTTSTVEQDGAAEPSEPPDRCRYADRRRQARPGDANYGAPYDTAAMSRGVTLRCALREAGPEVRLVVGGEYGIPMGVDVYIPATAARATQRLFMEDNDQRAREGSRLVEGEDLNRDGWTDLKVQTWSGSGGVFYDVFMYDPRMRRFAKDSVLSGGGGVVPLEGSQTCVGTGRRSGAGNWTSDDFCWRGGRWVHIRQRQQEVLGGYPDTRYVLTLREPRGRRLVTVRVDTTDQDAAVRKRDENR
ncbi:MAG TPA: hypothetical protein VFS20_23925 [Longimicrobium sp.]|nr:hypothetical protein [Longimicrobium sp.]